MPVLARVADAERGLTQKRRERIRQSGVGLLRQREILPDIGACSVQSPELTIAIEDPAARANRRLAMKDLRRPRDAHAGPEVFLIGEVERGARRAVLEPAREWVERQTDVLFVVVHAVIFIAQPGVQG